MGRRLVESTRNNDDNNCIEPQARSR